MLPNRDSAARAKRNSQKLENDAAKVRDTTVEDTHLEVAMISVRLLSDTRPVFSGPMQTVMRMMMMMVLVGM